MTERPLDEGRLAELVVALNHDDGWNRAYAATRLGQSHDPRALELVLGALDREPARWEAELSGALRRAHAEIARRTALWFDLQPFAESLGACGPGRETRLLAAHAEGNVAVRVATSLAMGSSGATRAADALVAALGDPDLLVRTAAATALGRLRLPQAIEPLMALTDARTEAVDVRAAAAAALCTCCQAHPDERALELLIRLLDEPIFPLTYHIMDALPALGEPSVPALIGTLRDETRGRGTRARAATVLGTIGDPRAIGPLLAVLADWRNPVCQVAGAALATLHAATAVPQLIDLLRLWDDPDRDRHFTAVEAARALGEMGDARALEPLLGVLEDPARFGRKRIAEALGKLGDTRALEPLVTLLRDSDVRLRSYTASALGRLEDRRAVEPLIAALADEWEEVRRHAAEALGALDDPRAVEPLIRALRYDSTYVRWSAIYSLQQIGDARAVGPLCDALRDPDETARRFVVSALGAMPDPRAVEPLIAALGDGSARMRLAVIEALGEIGDVRAASALRPVAHGENEALVPLRDAARAALEAVDSQQQPEREEMERCDPAAGSTNC